MVNWSIVGVKCQHDNRSRGVTDGKIIELTKTRLADGQQVAVTVTPLVQGAERGFVRARIVRRGVRDVVEDLAKSWIALSAIRKRRQRTIGRREIGSELSPGSGHGARRLTWQSTGLQPCLRALAGGLPVRRPGTGFRDPFPGDRWRDSPGQGRRVPRCWRADVRVLSVDWTTVPNMRTMRAVLRPTKICLLRQ